MFMKKPDQRGEPDDHAPARCSPPRPRSPAHYKEPDWFTRIVMNNVVKGLTRMGVSVWGSRVLEHRGRTTGKLHHVPVNLLTIDGTKYLVSPRARHSGCATCATTAATWC